MITARILWRAVPEWLKTALAVALTVAGVAMLAYSQGKATAEAECAAERLQADAETRERIDNADTEFDGPSAVDERLRDLADQ